MSTGDHIIGLRGLAGTGKTTTLRELANASQAAGFESLFCAPTAAATDVLRKEGFQAVTLQSLVLSKPALSGRHLIILDEAGAVGIDDMKQLFELGRSSRIVLSGDTGQHGAVPRGDALRILEQYSSLIQSDKSALLVAPTWAEINSVTNCVRNVLKEQSLLDSQEHSFRIFDSFSWTQAQKRDPRQYRSGMVLRFHRRQGGFVPGESVEVVAVGADAVTVRRPGGSNGQINLRRSSASFDAGEARELKVAAGDKLLLQANAARQHFINGELVQVQAIEGRSIALTDGRIIQEGYRSFTHGYAINSHSAQSKTVSEVFLVASSRSLPAVHQQQFYVSISRGRERCHVLTDDKELLRSHITRSSDRVAAVEILRCSPVRRHSFVRRVLQRAAHVRELVRLNARETLQRISPRLIQHPTRLLRSHTIKPHGNAIRIS